MLKFFYESIDTLKEVKVPTKQEVIKMTIIVFIVITIAAVLFAMVDYLFLHLHEDFIYNYLTNLFSK